MSLATSIVSRPFLRTRRSDEDLVSIAPFPCASSTSSGDLSDTDSDDLDFPYRHARHRTRPHHDNRARNGLAGTLPPTLSINTNAKVTSGQIGRDADLETLRHSLDVLPATQLREVILQVAFSNPRFQRAIQKEVQDVRSSFAGNGRERDILEGMAMGRKTDQITTPYKKRASYVLQTPPITPITARSDVARTMGSARHMQDSDEEDVQRGRPSWRAFRGCRLAKDGAEQTTSRRSRRHRRTAAGANKPPSFSDSHVERTGSQISKPSHDSDSECQVRTDNGHYHPGYLRDEEYEFVSRSPDGAACKVVRNVTMWSCCDEDARSPGCVRSFFAASQGKVLATSKADQVERPDTPDSAMEDTPFHSRPLSLDLDMPLYEGLIDDDAAAFSVFGLSKLSELEMMHSVSTLEDVYPDSDLESPYSNTPIYLARLSRRSSA